MLEAPKVWDAVVVGGGPAGLSAAAWLGRYRRSTLVFDGGEYRNRWTEKVHGYLGLDPIGPAELLEKSRAALSQYDAVDVDHVQVHAIEKADDDFRISSAGGEVRSRRVILAMGVVDRFPDIEGFEEHYGKSVFHCPDCDGYEAKGAEVVVLGWSEDIAGFATNLFNWAKTVTVVTDGKDLQVREDQRDRLAAKGIVIVEDTASRLMGVPGTLEGVMLGSGQQVDCDLLFFGLGETPRSELARQLGCATDEAGYVLVDDHGRTNIEWVYAAGDLTPGEHLVQVAAAEGTVAGIACARSLDPPRARPA